MLFLMEKNVIVCLNSILSSSWGCFVWTKMSVTSRSRTVKYENVRYKDDQMSTSGYEHLRRMSIWDRRSEDAWRHNDHASV